MAKDEKDNEQNKITCLAKDNISTSQQTQKRRKCSVEFYMKDNNGNKETFARNILDNEDFAETITGTPNKALSNIILSSAIQTLPKSFDEAARYNIIIQSLSDYAPKDAHEARLCAQAVVLHTHAMDFLERARNVLFDETFAKDHWHTILIKTATKLLDLHTKTIDTLMRYRQRGEQRIIVQHVSVSDGGKAIVGGVFDGGGVNKKK